MKKRRFKIQRRLKTVLPGFGDKKAKGPLEKRPNPPGQHGTQRQQKLSEYGIRLREKQKIRFHYGVTEKQLLVMIKKSKKRGGDWFRNFVRLIESRLDNTVFRLGFFPTMASARQMVNHGHVLVNGKKIDIPSYILKIGDVITLKEKTYENILFQKTSETPTLPLPEFLSLEEKDKKLVGKVVNEAQDGDVPFEFISQYFIEYYGKVK